MTVDPPIEVSGLTRFGLTTRDPVRLGDFYRQAFGCRDLNRRRLSGPAFEELMGVAGGAESTLMTLGDEMIELLAFDTPGMPYPKAASTDDPIFQHFAIVTDRMDEAYRRLSTVKGWTPISTHGPIRLPETSGGVTAFKFRDPEGHPLELLQFPTGATPPRWRRGPARGFCLGVDHSAITVRDADASLAFYAGLGFAVASRSLNEGPEQRRLDGLVKAVVDVLALVPARPAPHLELLSYRGAAPPTENQGRANDVASSRLTFEVAAGEAELFRRIMRADPDGHRLIIEAPGSRR